MTLINIYEYCKHQKLLSKVHQATFFSISYYQRDRYDDERGEKEKSFSVIWRKWKKKSNKKAEVYSCYKIHLVFHSGDGN